MSGVVVWARHGATGEERAYWLPATALSVDEIVALIEDTRLDNGAVSWRIVL